MSAWDKVVQTMFAGNQGIQHGNPNVIIAAADPNGSTQAGKGTLALIVAGDATDDDVYINTDGATAWTIVHDAVA